MKTERTVWRRALAAGLCSLTAMAQTPAPIEPARANVNGLLKPYVAAEVPAARLGNSGRLRTLVKAGTIYLSAQDAVALALENNIDVEVARYGPVSSQWRLLRAEAGGALPGVPSASSQAGSVASGQGVSGSQSAAGVSGGGGGGGRGGSSNASVTQIGPVTPNLDATIQQTTTFSHKTTPQANNTQSMINALVSDTRGFNYSIQQGILSGGQVSLSLNESYLKENSPSNVLNPTVAPSLSLSLQHNLLRGFGKEVNGRTIKISRINLAMSDETFRNRVSSVVAQVVNQYYGLVAAHEDAKAKRVAREVAATLVANVKAQVEIGAQAETEITRVAAQLASAQQALVVSETTLEQQELRLKNALSRNGLADPVVAAARIVPTDRIELPAADEIPAVAELVKAAKEKRPDLAVQKSSLETAKITSMGTRNGLLPTLVVIAGTSQSGLAGTRQHATSSGDYFVGGFGTAMGQVLRRNFPTERVGVFAQTSLGNNTAQADNAIDQLEYRQTELGWQKTQSKVEVDVQNAVTALKQARARQEAAVKMLTLQQALFDAEQRKFELGASIPQNVVQAQRDLVAAQASEVSARLSYSNARTALDQVLGRTLEAQGITVEEARTGRVTRASVAP